MGVPPPQKKKKKKKKTHLEHFSAFSSIIKMILGDKKKTEIS